MFRCLKSNKQFTVEMQIYIIEEYVIDPNTTDRKQTKQNDVYDIKGPFTLDNNDTNFYVVNATFEMDCMVTNVTVHT